MEEVEEMKQPRAMHVAVSLPQGGDEIPAQVRVMLQIKMGWYSKMPASSISREAPIQAYEGCITANKDTRLKYTGHWLHSQTHCTKSDSLQSVIRSLLYGRPIQCGLAPQDILQQACREPLLTTALKAWGSIQKRPDLAAPLAF